MKKFYTLLLLLFSSWVIANAQTIRYVKPVATGLGNGSSWANAADTLRGIVAAAPANTQVWVATGTYKPSPGTDIADAFGLKNGVKILGGFPGTGNPGMANRNMAANPTILSGDIGVPDTLTDNCLHVVVCDSGLNSSAVLDGFTITGGYAYGDARTHDEETGKGGGIYCYKSGPTITNCAIVKNKAYLYGGGVCNNGSSATYINCVIAGNSVLSAGSGMYIVNNSSVTLRNCSFSGNKAGFFAPALFYVTSDTTTITNCIFWNNAIRNPFDQIIGDSSRVKVTYSLVEGGYPGIGNIDIDPSFEDENSNNLRLTSCSPGINMGSNAALAATDTIDADGKRRIYNNGIVDMGAYESTAQTFPLGNPTEVGAGKWHVSVWRKADWNSYYAGYYTDTSLQFSTLAQWDSLASPSAAPGYQGCLASGRKFSCSAKRLGFPCGHYQINNIRHSDSADLRVNGVLVWAQTGTNSLPVPGIWEGLLGPNDKIEYRVTNTSGPAYGTLQLQRITSTVSTANNVLSFDGDRDYAGISACTGPIFPGGDSLTVEYWFKGTNTQSAVRMQADTNFIISGWSNKKHILSNSGGTDGGVAIGDGFNDGYWHHIAFAWAQGGLFTSYLDGKPVQQAAAGNQPLPVFNTGVYLGGVDVRSEFTQGSIEEVKVWTTVRTPQQIRTSADSICNTVGHPYGLLMHYNFNQGIGRGNNAGEKELVNQASPGERNARLKTEVPGGFALAGNSSNWVSFPLDSLVWFRDADGDGFGSKTDSIFACARPAGYVKNNMDCNDNLVPQLIRRFVNSAATGTNNGTSWANAYTSLQAALNATCLDTLEIWVAKGTYKPTTTSDASRFFALPFRAKLYGGFAGTETAPGQRNIAGNPTILSGDLAGNDVVTGAGATLSITGSDENSTTILSVTNGLVDGFTIRGAKNPSMFSGALISTGDSVRISNCIFTSNNAQGAAVNGTYVSISDCVFKNNIGISGGGIRCTGTMLKSVISHCQFLDNRATNLGGALSFNGLNAPAGKHIINGCTFSGNCSAIGAGAVLAGNYASVFGFSDCVFTGNGTSGPIGGGAIYSINKRCDIVNCTFVKNRLESDTTGGAIYSVDSTLRIKNSIFWNNFPNSLYDTLPITVDNSIIQNGGFAGLNNSTANPYFANMDNPIGPDSTWGTADDGLMLSGCSPAIDAGNNSGVSPTDYTGQPRIFNNTVDMGAYEYRGIPTTPPAVTTNNALRFDGVDDYVTFTDECGGNVSGQTGLQTFTLEALFQTTSTQGGGIIGFNNNRLNTTNATSYDRMLYLDANGKLVFGIYDNNIRSIVSPLSYNDGLSHHVAGTFSQTAGLKLYVDGQLVASNPIQTSAQAYNGYWKVGGFTTWMNSPMSSYFNGTLDEVRVWSKVRTPAEIQANAGELNLPQANLEVYYRFNHGAAGANNNSINTTLNHTGNSQYNGRLNNFALTGSGSNWVNSFYTACLSGSTTITWAGTQSTDWQNPANWNGGNLPTACTNVFIPGGTPFSLVITGNESICHKITVNSGANVRIATGAKLTVTGP